MNEVILLIYGFINEYITRSFIDTTNVFFERNYIYLVFVIVSTAYLIAHRQEHYRGYKLIYAFVIVVSSVIIYNPLFSILAIKLPKYNDAVLARNWILVPVWLLISFTLSIMLANIKQTAYKNLIVVIIVFSLLASGNSVNSLNYYISSNNNYKIRSEAIELSNDIIRINDNTPATILLIMPTYDVLDNYIYGGTVTKGITQYTGNIRCINLRLSQSDWNNAISYTSTSENQINEMLMGYYHMYQYDYVACPNNESVTTILFHCGFNLVATSGGFNIYKYDMSEESVLIANEVLLLNHEEPTSLFLFLFKEDNTEFNSVFGRIWGGIRYYTDSISLGREWITEDDWNTYYSVETDSANYSIALDHLQSFLDGHDDYEYIALPANDRVTTIFAECGYSLVGSVCGYNIYTIID